MCSGRWDKPCRLTKPPTFSRGHSGDGAMKRERGVVTTNGILPAPDLTATVKLGLNSSYLGGPKGDSTVSDYDLIQPLVKLGWFVV
jgi:hypothetical protein